MLRIKMCIRDRGKITQLGAHLYTILNSYFYYALSCRNGDAVDSVIGRMGIMLSLIHIS